MGAFKIVVTITHPCHNLFYKNVFAPPGRGGHTLSFEKVNTKSFATI
jgi:hypothetical protein